MSSVIEHDNIEVKLFHETRRMREQEKSVGKYVIQILLALGLLCLGLLLIPNN